MATTILCSALKKNSSDFGAKLNEFRLQEELCDVSISCNDATNLKCHRVVLAMGSPYFHGLFQSALFSGDTLSLPFDSDIVQTVVGWLYKQTPNMDYRIDCLQLIKCADFLNMNELLVNAITIVNNLLTPETVVDIYNHLAGLAPKYVNYAQMYLIQLLNRGDVFGTENLTEISCQGLLNQRSLCNDNVYKLLVQKLGGTFKEISNDCSDDSNAFKEFLVIDPYHTSVIQTPKVYKLFDFEQMEMLTGFESGCAIENDSPTEEAEYHYFAFLNSLYEIRLIKHEDRTEIGIHEYDFHIKSWLKRISYLEEFGVSRVNGALYIHIVDNILIIIIGSRWLMLLDMCDMLKRTSIQLYQDDKEYDNCQFVGIKNKVYFFNSVELLLIDLNKVEFSINIEKYSSAKIDVSTNAVPNTGKTHMRCLVFHHNDEIMCCTTSSTFIRMKKLDCLSMEWKQTDEISDDGKLHLLSRILVANNTVYGICRYKVSSFCYIIRIDMDSTGCYQFTDYKTIKLGRISHICGHIKMLREHSFVYGLHDNVARKAGKILNQFGIYNSTALEQFALTFRE